MDDDNNHTSTIANGFPREEETHQIHGKAASYDRKSSSSNVSSSVGRQVERYRRRRRKNNSKSSETIFVYSVLLLLVVAVLPVFVHGLVVPKSRGETSSGNGMWKFIRVQQRYGGGAGVVGCRCRRWVPQQRQTRAPSLVLWATRRRRQRQEHPSANDSNRHDCSTDNNGRRRIELETRIAELNYGTTINARSPKQVSAAIFGSVGQSVTRNVLEMVAEGKLRPGGKVKDSARARELASLVLQLRRLDKEHGSSSGKTAGAPERQRAFQRNATTPKRPTTLQRADARLGASSAMKSAGSGGGGSRSSRGIGNQQQATRRKSRSAATPAYSSRASRVPRQEESCTARRKGQRSPLAAKEDDDNDVLSSFDRKVRALFDNDGSGRKLLLHSYWKELLLRLTRPSARALVAQLNSAECPMGYDPLPGPKDLVSSSAVSSELTAGAAAFNPTGTSCTAARRTTGAGKAGSFLAYCREQKIKHPECIILTRCGDFYEAFGVDAIMLVEHCGLNPMASKAKAGCPYRNVQATLDGLTAAGFRVAVYEEANDTNALRGPSARSSNSRIKSRFLAQQVSPACPTYLYGDDQILLQGHADSLSAAIPCRPYVGILSEAAAGYTVVEVSMEEQTVRVAERLTAEAVACRLAANPPADPLFYVPSATDYDSGKSSPRLKTELPFVPSQREMAACGGGGGPGSARLRTRIVPPNLVPRVTRGVSHVDRAKGIVLNALLRETERQDEEQSSSNRQRSRLCVEDFTLISSSHFSSSSNAQETWTHPLYMETAKQLGLMNDPAIPCLVSHLLPNSAPACSRRFLRRFLLTPPPPAVARAMSDVVSHAKESPSSLPPLHVPPVGKALSLLRAGQASAQVYGELLRALDSTIVVLEDQRASSTSGGSSSRSMPPSVVDSLMVLVEHESGLAADPASLRARCTSAVEAIEAVVSPLHHAGARSGDRISEELGFSIESDDDDKLDCVTDLGNVIPRAFLERNEVTWRGRVRRSAAPEAYRRVEETAERLAEAVAEDFGGEMKIVQDIFNNMIAIKEIPTINSRGTSMMTLEEGSKIVDEAQGKYIHPRDRNGKVLRNRYTTDRVRGALSDYVSACEEARLAVSNVLVKLSRALYDDGHIPAVVQSSHACLLLSSAHFHAARANALVWHMADLVEREKTENSSSSSGDGSTPDGNGNSDDCALALDGVWPYWMDKSEAVANTFTMKGMWLLTAPNMSGKSTVMRSTAAAALLTACGLCAPVGPGSRVTRFDHLIVRGASSDVPAEHKSAFGSEMGDVAALFRCCGDESLVFVDELGRGTSPRDGTRIAGAVLERMASRGMSGIFATHLHDVLDLPLRGMERISNKKMCIHPLRESDNADEDEEEEDEAYSWTYRVEDGVCTDSMALVTAAQFGLPPEILRRADELAQFLSSAGGSSATTIKLPLPPTGPVAVNGFANGAAASALRTTPSSLAEIAPFLAEKTGQEPVRIPPRWQAPACMDGKSCLYVLQLDAELSTSSPSSSSDPSSSSSSSSQDTLFYVGETDNFRQRLEQHRSKKGKDCRWFDLSALVVPAPGGRSEARAWESQVIQALAQRGVPLQSTWDGRRIARRT